MVAEAPPPPVALYQDHVPDDLICSICMTLTAEPLLTPCDHIFCRTCIHQALGNQSICPIDRRPCTHGQLRGWMDFLCVYGVEYRSSVVVMIMAALGGGQLQTTVLICKIAPSTVVETHWQGRTITITQRWKKSWNLSERIMHHYRRKLMRHYDKMKI